MGVCDGGGEWRCGGLGCVSEWELSGVFEEGWSVECSPSYVWGDWRKLQMVEIENVLSNS